MSYDTERALRQAFVIAPPRVPLQAIRARAGSMRRRSVARWSAFVLVILALAAAGFAPENAAYHVVTPRAPVPAPTIT